MSLVTQAERILQLHKKACDYLAEVDELQEKYNDVMNKAAKDRLDRLKFLLKIIIYGMTAVGGAATLLAGRFKVFIDFQAWQ